RCSCPRQFPVPAPAPPIAPASHASSCSISQEKATKFRDRRYFDKNLLGAQGRAGPRTSAQTPRHGGSRASSPRREAGSCRRKGPPRGPLPPAPEGALRPPDEVGVPLIHGG